MKQYVEGVDYEWRPIDGVDGALARHFFTRAEKDAMMAARVNTSVEKDKIPSAPRKSVVERKPTPVDTHDADLADYPMDDEPLREDEVVRESESLSGRNKPRREKPLLRSPDYTESGTTRRGRITSHKETRLAREAEEAALVEREKAAYGWETIDHLQTAGGLISRRKGRKQ